MFSPFSARRPEEPRSGGKAPRERRRTASASPYARQANLSPPPARQAGNPSWFSGIFTGAGKLLSSVFRSDGGESLSSYSSDADSGGNGSSDEDDNGDACTKEFHELDETGRSCKSCTMRGEGSQLVTQRSERKLSIEKLLLQETFSRDESDRLIKIIQSRVVDTMDGGKAAGQAELSDKNIYSDATFLGNWRSLNRERKFPGGLAYSASHRNDLSPGVSILSAYAPDLCDKAIMEAKKWVEEKKMESASKSKLECGPCTLNTDAFQYRVEDETDSPVDIAKSYMRARPPWQSPILSSIGFKTPSSGMLLFKDETPYAIEGDSFSTSKVLKRSYLDTDFDDGRNVRLKSLENPPSPTISQQVEPPSTRVLEHDIHQTADERNLAAACTNNDSNSLSRIEASKPVDASSGIPQKLTVDDSCPEVNLNSPDATAIQVEILHSLLSSEMTKQVDSATRQTAKSAVEDGCPEAIFSSHEDKTFEANDANTETDKINETHNLSSADVISNPEENVNGVSLNHETSARTVLPPEMETGVESLSSAFDCADTRQRGAGKDVSLGPETTDALTIKTNQDLEVSSMEKQVKGVSVPDEFTSLEPSVHLKVSDARDAELPNAEGAELPTESVKSPTLSKLSQPSNDSIVHVAGVHVDLIVSEIRQDYSFTESELEIKDTSVDTSLLDGKDQVEKEAISATASAANGDLPLQAGSSSNSYIRSSKKGGRHLPTSNNGRPATADVPVDHRTSSIPEKPQNGTTRKSIERMLAESSPNTRQGRGRKVVAKTRRGRGRGK